MTINAKLIKQIQARAIKGYAFYKYPTEWANSAEEYRAKSDADIQQDAETLTEAEFNEKYSRFIY